MRIPTIWISEPPPPLILSLILLYTSRILRCCCVFFLRCPFLRGFFPPEHAESLEGTQENCLFPILSSPEGRSPPRGAVDPMVSLPLRRPSRPRIARASKIPFAPPYVVEHKCFPIRRSFMREEGGSFFPRHCPCLLAFLGRNLPKELLRNPLKGPLTPFRRNVMGRWLRRRDTGSTPLPPFSPLSPRPSIYGTLSPASIPFFFLSEVKLVAQGEPPSLGRTSSSIFPRNRWTDAKETLVHLQRVKRWSFK